MQKKTLIELGILAALGIIGVIVMENRSAIGSAVADYVLPAAGKPFQGLITQAASDNGVPWQLLAAQLQQESYFNPLAVNNASGALGIAQFEPFTASMLGIDPMDPAQAIPGQAQYMASLKTQIASAGGPDSWAYALAAYDWGIGHVQRAIAQGLPPAKWPTETRNYVQRITSHSGIDTETAKAFA